MGGKRRQGAAEIFRQQNVMQAKKPEQQDEEEIADYLKPRARLTPSPSAPPPEPPGSGMKTSEELQLEKEPIRVRETGFFLWRRVVVPPNVYVVHTRIGRKEPVTIGLGVSFRYNPNTDAYLVVPAAMQTIGVVANCISKEKQGINILAYVQWQIDDFAVAYRRLDFSDSRDPLGIVNAQLREQAEAAVKDKIATMSVEEVLTDKEPVIEELTTRLKLVAEGRAQETGSTDEGLGIKIVTVQIKEALVSSQRLWEHLQAPYRHEQEQAARISQLTMQQSIQQKELETRQIAETSQAESMVEIERTKQEKETEAEQIRLTQEATRFEGQQESKRQQIQLEEQTTLIARESESRLSAQQAQAEQEQRIEQARLDAEASQRRKALEVERQLAEMAEQDRLEAEQVQARQAAIERQTALKAREAEFEQVLQQQADQLANLRLEAETARERQEKLVELELHEAAETMKLTLLEKEVEIARLQQEVRNLINERDLTRTLIERMPELAANMPDIDELRVLQTSGDTGQLAGFLAQMMALAESLGLKLGGATSGEDVDD